MMGTALLKRRKDEYKKLIRAIRDQPAFRVGVYPTTLHDAYELLESHSVVDNGRAESVTRTRKERETVHRRGRGADGRDRGSG